MDVAFLLNSVRSPFEMGSKDPWPYLRIITPKKKTLRSTLLEVSYRMHVWLGNKYRKKEVQKKKRISG